MEYCDFKERLESLLRERYKTIKEMPAYHPLTHVMDEANCTTGSWLHERLLEEDEAIRQQRDAAKGNDDGE